MSEENKVKDEQLENVVGGVFVGDILPQHFSVGDRVLLYLYPSYGVGIVREAKVVSRSWQYTVQFDSGMITADEFEFIPA